MYPSRQFVWRGRRSWSDERSFPVHFGKLGKRLLAGPAATERRPRQGTRLPASQKRQSGKRNPSACEPERSSDRPPLAPDESEAPAGILQGLRHLTAIPVDQRYLREVDRDIETGHCIRGVCGHPPLIQLQRTLVVREGSLARLERGLPEGREAFRASAARPSAARFRQWQTCPTKANWR